MLRVITIFFFLMLTKQLFSQDTTNKIVLKPLRETSYSRMPTRSEIDAQVKKEIDSIYNSRACQKIRDEYDSLCKANHEKIMASKRTVEDLNKTNSGFLYFIVLECTQNVFDFKDCPKTKGVWISSSSDICDYFEVKIEKKEKSRLILDGPDGEVFYYEDIRRMPDSR